MTVAVRVVALAGLVVSANAWAAPRTMLVPVERGPALVAPLEGPNVLFLNDCKPDGCLVRPGANDDSRTNTSSIVRQPSQLAAFSGDQLTWDAAVACVRENFAPYNISVVTTDPGNVPHFEEMVAGLPAQVGFPNGVAGVSPFSCGVINNAITFTFANLTPNDALALCWTVSQEAAHAFGLEHSMLGTDAMTYIADPPRKMFVDETACVGAAGCCQPSQECQCNRTTINSHQRLMEVLGSPPPTVTVQTPMEGERVDAGFAIRVDVVDPQGVGTVEILVDDAIVGTFSAPPYEVMADAGLAIGPHTIVVRAQDLTGTRTTTPPLTVQREDLPEPAVPDAGAEPEPPKPAGEGGCRTTQDGGLALLVVGFALVMRRRRYRANV
jgi:MYXO-CTERM domain-containing protein